MALYAFCREVDDVVDECHDISIASTKLDLVAPGDRTRRQRPADSTRLAWR
jgi:phytoene/squalene synthetase